MLQPPHPRTGPHTALWGPRAEGTVSIPGWSLGKSYDLEMQHVQSGQRGDEVSECFPRAWGMGGGRDFRRERAQYNRDKKQAGPVISVGIPGISGDAIWDR